ncbi:MAG: PAS domain S-box protein [Thermodesulfobacteriota bacterium]
MKKYSDMSRDELINEIHHLQQQLVGDGEHLDGREVIKSFQFYKNIFMDLPIGMTVCDSSGQCVEANNSIGEIIGASREQVLTQNYNHIESWKESGLLDVALKASSKGVSTKKEISFTSTFGKQINVEVHFLPFSSEGSNYLLSIFIDLTELRKVESELDLAKEQLDYLLETNPAVIYKCDATGDFPATFISENITNQLGYKSEDFLASPSFWANNIHPDDKQRVFDELGELFKENKFTHEYRFKHKDGHYVWMLDQLSLVRDSDGNPKDILGCWIDISERRKTEKSLRESEERYRSLFENATDIIQVVRPDGQLLYVNPSWCSTLGYTEEEARNLKVFDIIHPDCADKCELHFNKTMTEGTSGIIDVVFKNKDGRKVFMQGSSNCKYSKGQPVYVHCIFRDVTERRLMEEELNKMQKLESLGILAGGIAHDFNNILTATIGNLSLARALAKPGEKIYKRIEQAEKASLRAKDLTQQLLTFSKGGEPIKVITSLNEVIMDSCQFVLRGSNVNCNFGLIDDLWLVEVDEGQISQVIHNLVINADQAMPDGGTIIVHAENVHINSKDEQPLNDGDYVLITVEDQGLGISEKHLKKIFDPYFSTKQKGHGLGLATAYSIIKKHSGLLTAESKLGEGSVFKLYLPASIERNIGKASAREEIHLGKGSILLMDDEEHIREVAKEILDYLGYQVTTAVDGRQATEMYSKALKENTPIDVVILDLTVPGGMGGKETLKKLIKIDPSVKAIVSSGYANDPIMANFKQYGFSGVVPKPYRIEDVSKALLDLLNSN